MTGNGLLDGWVVSELPRGVTVDKKRFVTVAGVVLTVIAVGTGVGVAARAEDDPPLRGQAFDKAVAAALQHMGGGTVTKPK